MANTGYKYYASLELYYKDNKSAVGVPLKPNIITDPDYIAPVLDTETCAPSVRYYNVEKKLRATKNNCGNGYVGSNVTMTAYPNQFVSKISVADANAQADAWLAANVQTYANGLGTCELFGDYTPPSAPSISSSTGSNETTIDLFWDVPYDNEGVTGFEIYRKSAAEIWHRIFSTDDGLATSYSDSSLTIDTTYFYKIRARDAASNWSEFSIETGQTTGINV